MVPGRPLLRKLGMLLVLGSAGSLGASIPQADGWSADPESQFLLDVRIRQTRLADGVRAYATPEGTCINFGDLMKAIDAPIQVDLARKSASGWVFKENNRISVDLAGGIASYRGIEEPIADHAVRETPDGWCVDSGALSRWLGISVKPVTSGSTLILQSEAKLPVELAAERQARAAQLKTAKFDLNSLPQVRLPYRMWRAPALDFVVSAGVTYRAGDGMRVDRRSSVLAAGEIAHLSYDAQFSTNDKGLPSSLRVRAYRSDPDGALLGPLQATHFGVGDVAGLDSRLTGNSASGRGAVVTNRPLLSQSAFDRTRFEGDLPVGWEAELYRNGELLAFAKPTADQRYLFDNVQLMYGENKIGIVLYGPQGQVRTREELINVGQDHVPAGKTWYWAGANQPGRDLAVLHKPPDDAIRPRAQAALSLEHGIDERTSVGALARMMLVGDERLSFVEGTVRRSVGAAMVEVAAAGDSAGGKAARAQILAKFGSVNVSAEAIIADDFHLQGAAPVTSRDLRLMVDAPLRIGRATIPAHADVRFTDRLDGTKQVEAAARLAANVQRFNLATDVRYRKQLLRSGSTPGELNVALLGTGRVGDVRIRGSGSFDVSPEARFRAAELSAYWQATDRTDWEAGISYDAVAKRGLGRISHIRRLNAMAVAVTGEAASDGSLALGVNLNFSLDPGRGLKLFRQPLASSGSVHARVYRDLNDNGVRDPAEPLEKGALVTTGKRLAEQATDARGSVLVGGLSAYLPVTVGIDESSLADPMLVPRKALQVVVPRPGVPAEVEIGLVGGGDIEGAMVKSGGIGFEGLDLELVDSAGKVVATSRTDLDGFFLFERAPYGDYRVRLSVETARALDLPADIGVNVRVSPERSVVRLGSIPIGAPRIASRE